MHQGDVIAAFMRHAAGSSVTFVSHSSSREVRVLGPTSAAGSQGLHHICIDYDDAALRITPELADALPGGLATPHPSSRSQRLSHRICLQVPPSDFATPDQLVSALISAALRARLW